MNEPMRYVVESNNYDFMKRTMLVRNRHEGDMLIDDFVVYPKGRINVTYIPTDNVYKTEGDMYSRWMQVHSPYFDSLEKLNRTLSDPFRIYEYNMLSYFQKPDYQISLSAILEVFLPKVWTIIILFLFLFNFLTIAKRLVPRVHRFLVGVPDTLLLGNTYESAKKVILATYFVGCFILMEVFKANLSTKLTVDIDRNIHVFDDIFKYPNMPLVFDVEFYLVNYLRESRKDVLLEYERRFQKMNRRKGDEDDVFNQGNAVYFGTVHHFEYMCLHGYKAGKDLHYGRDPFYQLTLAFQVSKAASNRLKDLINLRILNYWETGHQIRANFLLNRKACSKYLKTKQSLAFSKTSLGDVGPIFLVYVSSMTISFLVMLIELRHAFNN